MTMAKIKGAVVVDTERCTFIRGINQKKQKIIQW